MRSFFLLVQYHCTEYGMPVGKLRVTVVQGLKSFRDGSSICCKRIRVQHITVDLDGPF